MARTKNGTVDPRTASGAKRGRRSAPAPRPTRRAARPVRYAVVGLGWIAQSAVLPAFAHTRSCELAALVSDDVAKLDQLGRRHRVAARFPYERFDECLKSGIDAVYIALPNHLHHRYAIAAAAAGVHVLCEKPMALSVRQCQEMIDAARAGGVKLMIGYRLHFERANLDAIARAGRSELGELRFFSSTFSMQVKEGDTRVRRETGGGSVWDLGIYCINAARYLFRTEPVEVAAMSASGDDPRFAEVDEMTTAIMRFPGARLAQFTASFGAASVAAYDLVGTQGSLRLDPAYEYSEELRRTLTVGGRTREKTFPRSDQFAAELDYFAQCIRDDREPEPSGAEGLADVRVIEAIYRAAQSHRPVELPPLAREVAHPDPGQAMHRTPSPQEPELVHTEPPSAED